MLFFICIQQQVQVNKVIFTCTNVHAIVQIITTLVQPCSIDVRSELMLYEN